MLGSSSVVTQNVWTPIVPTGCLGSLLQRLDRSWWLGRSAGAGRREEGGGCGPVPQARRVWDENAMGVGVVGVEGF